MLASGGAEPAIGAHRAAHRVLEPDALGPDVQRLARLAAAVRTGVCLENSAQLAPAGGNELNPGTGRMNPPLRNATLPGRSQT